MWTIDIDDGVAQVRLDRPEKRNALGTSFWNDFPDAVRRLSDSGEVRAAVLSGNGPSFCAGIDLDVLASGGLSTETAALRERFHRVVRQMQEPFDALEAARFPVVAAVHGHCLGGGMALATAADLRVLCRDAILRVEEVNIGLMADIGTIQRLPALLPLGVVHELATLGLPLDPDRAVTLGFASSVHDSPEAALAEATRLARRVADMPTLAVAATKREVLHARDTGVEAALDHVALRQSAAWEPADIMAAIAARGSGTPGDYARLEPLGPRPFTPPRDAT